MSAACCSFAGSVLFKTLCSMKCPTKRIKFVLRYIRMYERVRTAILRAKGADEDDALHGVVCRRRCVCARACVCEGADITQQKARNYNLLCMPLFHSLSARAHVACSQPVLLLAFAGDASDPTATEILYEPSTVSARVCVCVCVCVCSLFKFSLNL